jgi:tetratricopeptide (TPR) repeat protein
MKRLAALALLVSVATVMAQPEAERAKTAKALMFDRKYTEARKAWQDVLAVAKGREAETAAFQIARCSDNLGEHQRAMTEYEEFLARHPADKALAVQARTNRVGLATRLYKAGQRQHLDVLRQALSDPSKSVRYPAALQLGGLGPEVGLAALPVLKEIVGTDTDEDLVQRAKLVMLLLDSKALSDVPPPPRPRPAAPTTRMLKVRIFEKGHERAKVSINVPLGLAEVLFKSLPEDAKRDLRKKGYDADTFWSQLMKLPPAQIIDIEGDQGERIQIWIE